MARHAIAHEEQEQDAGRIGRHQHDHQHQDDQHHEGHAAAQVEVLEGVERRVRHHGQAGIDRHDPGQPAQLGTGGRNPARGMPVGGQPDQARHQRRRRRAGQPLEVALVYHLNVGVEACQPQGCSGHIDEGGQPAPLAHAGERPRVDDQCRRGPEGDHVGQRVVLLAEHALAVGQACHPAIEAVEEHGQEDGDGRPLELAVHGHHDGIETGKQVGRGEGVGQQVDAPPVPHGRLWRLDPGIDLLDAVEHGIDQAIGTGTCCAPLPRLPVPAQTETLDARGARPEAGRTAIHHCS